MGNFSVNHYARLTPVEGGLRIRYVLDLAEIPTFELMQDWGAGTDPNTPRWQRRRARTESFASLRAVPQIENRRDHDRAFS